MTRPEISVVVPLLNEAANLREPYERLTKVLERLARGYELVLVDDGSTDETFPIIRELQAADPRVHVLRLRRNFGQTAAPAAGFDIARGEVIVAMDGDLQHAPEDIPALLERIDAGFDIASGWRERRVDSFLLRRMPSLVANKLMAWLSGIPLHDLGTTFKAYRREVIKGIELFGELHRFVPALASWRGVAIAEVPISNIVRRRGASHYGLSRTFRVLFDLLTVKFLIHYLERPLQFFGGWGLALSAAGFLILAAMSLLKLLGALSIMENLGMLLLSILLMIVGIQFVAVGLATEVSSRIYHRVRGHKIYALRQVLSARPPTNRRVDPRRKIRWKPGAPQTPAERPWTEATDPSPFGSELASAPIPGC